MNTIIFNNEAELLCLIFNHQWLSPFYLLPLHPVVQAGTPVTGNDEVERNLVLVEKVAYSRGLSPEAISVMLEFAMSLRMGKAVT